MYKVAVITDSETATGFRLAGVEVREAAAPEDALGLIREYAAAGYGLLIVNEDLLRGTDDARARILRDRDLPVVVPLPPARAKLESGEAYIARLVKEHIGFAVKLK
ncbi:MAG: V-type ATP synthase subunit F [Bacillati bacterium ANGP1]|uniref:V-type ATP synthase subunit F n=1 Tax=Candidatus Segetimicrobium genomatis TaxID=2569760 RepID=A0A537JL34_9BACT|nr:MAG: V-type ATP synthase subunit F [Terrabacteria group bacterium ANGP1]